MGIFTVFKAQKAYKLHSNGQFDEAKKLYQEALDEGMNQANYLLPYATLLIRTGEFQKARDLLVKAQKAPGITPEQKATLFMNYAACVYKMGEIDKGIAILERQHAKRPVGIIYQTLGYLYIEKLMEKPDPNAPAPVVETAPVEPDVTDEEAAPTEPAAPQLTPYQQWEQLLQKATAFIQESVDYDDEDSICLDNMAQLHYRILGDKEGALPWFQKAHKIKPGQIDTLWFLSRYDLEKGDTEAAVKKLTTMLDGKFSVLNHVTKAEVEAELKRLGK